MNVEPTVYLSAGAFVASLFFALFLLILKLRYRRTVLESKKKEAQLAQKVYESEVLRGVSEQIGYTQDITKILELISSSLDRLMPYSVISYLLDSGTGKRVKFWCRVKEPVSSKYLKELKTKMLIAFMEMSQSVLIESDLEDGVSGGLIDDNLVEGVGSFFNLPIIISGKVVAIVNISSREKDLYDENNTEVLFRMATQVSQTVTRLQDLIKNEKGRLEQAIESLSDGFLMVDTSFRLMHINSKLQSILNLPEKPTMHDITLSLQSKLDLRTCFESVLASASGKGFEHKKIEIAGKYLQVSIAKVVEHNTTQAMGAIAIFYDVTDAKNLEKIRSEFIALMIHELRSPLTTIKSTAEYINEEGVETFKKDELEHHLHIIDSTSQSMLDLVSDLLDVAKIESGKFDVVSEPGDLKSAIIESFETFKPLAQEKKLRFEVKINEDLPGANFDKIRTKQVLNNLISNAIKFTDAGSIQVTAATEKVNGQPADILVSVKDSGIGIDPDSFDKLFTRFGQLGAGRNQAGLKSSGLGLFITKGIITAMGGKIWAVSPGPGLGTTFNFTVPMARERQAEISDEEAQIVFSTKRVARA